MRTTLAAVAIVLVTAGLGRPCLTPARGAGGQGNDGGPADLPRPTWEVGDTWVVETETDRIQGRDNVEQNPSITRWRFRVSKLEKVAGRDCFRIDIACLAKGRTRPQTTIWCDAKTLVLRQLRTQLVFAGSYRTIHESYDFGEGQRAPVLGPLNALPIDLPAFLPPGSKSLDTFTYTSQPAPAGSKDPTILSFAHEVKQDVQATGNELRKLIPQAFAKDLDEKRVAKVEIRGPYKSVMQLWQEDQPWPVYVNNGRTQARLVSTGNNKE